MEELTCKDYFYNQNIYLKVLEKWAKIEIIMVNTIFRVVD